VFLASPAPQAVAALQQLQVKDGFQRRRGDMHAPAIADLAEIEFAELAVAQARLRAARARQTNAM
jgi:hypothetical protein